MSDGVPNYNFVFTCNGHSYDFTSTNYIMAAFNFDAEEITDAFLTLLGGDKKENGIKNVIEKMKAERADKRIAAQARLDKLKEGYKNDKTGNA